MSRTVWVLPGRKPWRQVFSWRGLYMSFVLLCLSMLPNYICYVEVLRSYQQLRSCRAKITCFNDALKVSLPNEAIILGLVADSPSVSSKKSDKWAMAWQNQQNGCAPSKDSNHPGHPPSLIRIFAVRIKKPWVLSYPLSTQQRHWSVWADAQADLSLLWAHGHFVGFVHVMAPESSLSHTKFSNNGTRLIVVIWKEKSLIKQLTWKWTEW